MSTELKFLDKGGSFSSPQDYGPHSGGASWIEWDEIFFPATGLGRSNLIGNECEIRKWSFTLELHYRPQWGFTEKPGKQFRVLLCVNKFPKVSTEEDPDGDNMVTAPILSTGTTGGLIRPRSFRNLDYTSKYEILVDDTFTLKAGNFIPYSNLPDARNPWGASKTIHEFRGEAPITGLPAIELNVPKVVNEFGGHSSSRINIYPTVTTLLSGTPAGETPWTATGETTYTGQGRIDTFEYNSSGDSTHRLNAPAHQITGNLEFPEEEPETLTLNLAPIESETKSGGVREGESIRREYHVDMKMPWIRKPGSSFNPTKPYDIAMNELFLVICWDEDKYADIPRATPEGLIYPIYGIVNSRIRFADD